MSSSKLMKRNETPVRKAASNSSTRGAAFLAFATKDAFPVTVLATSVPPRGSPASLRAAQVMVGAVDAERVPRLAERLDELVRLDKEHRKHGR